MTGAAPSWRDRIAARRAGLRGGRLAHRRVPEPFPAGDPDRARAYLAGQVRLAHTDMAIRDGGTLWDVAAPVTAFEAARQAFDWLDDLEALGTSRARALARRWVGMWLGAQGDGHGPGWTLPRAAPRLSRLLAHSDWLAAGEEGIPQARLERAFAIHLRFATARLVAVPGGTEGLVLCARLVACAAGLDGGHVLRERAQTRLETLAAALVVRDGGTPDRCPETLARIFAHLAAAARALEMAGIDPFEGHLDTLARVAPVLRALRHPDGHLARFHGGGAGSAGALDAALAAAGQRGGEAPRRPMGYVALRRGRTSLIADAALPPVAAAPQAAHASTLAVELTVGRQPLVVNCGSGAGFGPDWRHAARRTPSHSGLTVAGTSSATFEERPGQAAAMTEAPGNVEVDLQGDAPAARLSMAHDGYAARFGLIHVRRLDLTLDGGQLVGEDLLSAVTAAEKRRFTQARLAATEEGRDAGPGIAFAVRFHLHPDVSASLDLGANRVSLRLPNGDVWGFRHGEGVSMRLDPSVYLENTRAEPVPCQQIVLFGRARQHATSVTWRLSRQEGLPAFRRDTPREKGEGGA